MKDGYEKLLEDFRTYGQINLPHNYLKNLQYWADDYIREKLTGLFPSCSRESLWNSMENYLRVFRSILQTIAENSGLVLSYRSLDYAEKELRYLKEKSSC